MAPEPGRVKRRDVPAALAFGCQFGCQCVRLTALPGEVVGRLARRARPHPGHPLGVERQRRIEEHHLFDEPGEPEREVLNHRAAKVSGNRNHALVSQVVMDERVDVPDMRGHIVESIGANV